MTICSPGVNEDILDAAFLRLFFIFLGANGVNMTLTPLVAGGLLNKVDTQIATEHFTDLGKLDMVVQF